MFVFLPISDENPTPNKPYLTWSLITINFLVFLYQLSLTGSANQMLVNEFGVKPSVFFEMQDLHTILTSAFLHAAGCTCSQTCFFCTFTEIILNLI